MARKTIKGSRLPNRIIRRLIYFFALEISATRAAKEAGIHRHSAERVYDTIRKVIVGGCERKAPLAGEIEVDESYFGGYRKGNRGIESFGAFAKTKPRRYYEVRRNHFFLYLKGMEFRFNHRHENIEVVITKILRRGVKDLD